jgi:hypothetical protein
MSKCLDCLHSEDDHVTTSDGFETCVHAYRDESFCKCTEFKEKLFHRYPPVLGSLYHDRRT